MIDNENRFSILNQIFEGHLFDFTISFNFWGHMVSSSRKTLPQFSERNPLTASATDHQRFSTPVSSRNSRENKIQLLKKNFTNYLQENLYTKKNTGLEMLVLIKQINKRKLSVRSLAAHSYSNKSRKQNHQNIAKKLKKKSRQTDINLKRNLHQPRYINQATGENSR